MSLKSRTAGYRAFLFCDAGKISVASSVKILYHIFISHCISGALMKKICFADRKAFTLAEVLITLAIIGIVAAMTIPIVIARTTQSEYRTGAKKAFTTLSNVVQQLALQEDMAPEDYEERTDAQNQEYVRLMKQRLQIMREETDSEGNPVFYTTDGIRFHMINSYTYYVDANGDKAPDKLTTAKSDWKTAQYEDDEDLLNLSWDNVKLSDMFYIYFNPENGRGIIAPYVSGIESIVDPQTNP